MVRVETLPTCPRRRCQAGIAHETTLIFLLWIARGDSDCTLVCVNALVCLVAAFGLLFLPVTPPTGCFSRWLLALEGGEVAHSLVVVFCYALVSSPAGDSFPITVRVDAI